MLTPTVMDGDSADFARQSYLLGLVHPPGYPLMGMLGRAITAAVPFGGAAWRANLVGALTAAVALLLGYAIVRRWAASRLCAALSMGALAFSPLFWSQALFINPYMPQLVLTLGVILLLLVWADRERRLRWLLAAAALYGFGLGGHPSFVLYAPAIAAFVIVVLWRDGLRRAGRVMSAGVGAALVGCLPWLAYTLYFLSARSNSAQEGLVSRLLALLTASGSPSDPGLFVRGILSPGYTAQVARHGAATLGQFSPVGALLALGGAVALLRGRWRSLLLVGLAYVAQANFACTLPHWHFYDVYRLPTYAFLALFIGVGVAILWRQVRTRWPQYGLIAGLAALCVLPGHVLLRANQDNEEARGGWASLRPQRVSRAAFAAANRADCADALERAAPDGALVAAWGTTGTLRFLQDVEGLTPGVWIIGDGPEGAALRWYLEHPEHQRPRLYVLLREDDTGLRKTLLRTCRTKVALRGQLHRLHRVIDERGTDEGLEQARLANGGEPS
jgi:4-amino-4-deoxy-L-arabinose transferase-like glycosyltransferase